MPVRRSPRRKRERGNGTSSPDPGNVNPALWGPALWRAMFACAWGRKDDENAAPLLKELLLEQVPELLPCELCRSNFVKHLPSVNHDAEGEPSSGGEHAFRWLWHLKNQVNSKTQHPSLRLEHLVERYVLHGAEAMVHEVELADALVLVAIVAAERKQQASFVDLCASLHLLLPLPDDSALRTCLGGVRGPGVVNEAHLCAKYTREQHGYPEKKVAHYGQMVEYK